MAYIMKGKHRGDGKYKPTMTDFESQGGVERLKKNGMTKKQITDSYYWKCDGMNPSERQDFARKFYIKDDDKWS